MSIPTCRHKLPEEQKQKYITRNKIILVGKKIKHQNDQKGKLYKSRVL